MNPTPTQSLADLVRQLILDARREYEEASRETVQVTVWIVALATGILSVAVINEKILSGIQPTKRTVLVLLLLASILLGVLQRVLQHISNQFAGSHLRSLTTRLIGFASKASGTIPPDPETLLSPEAVVAACRDYFGLDYSFLLKAGSDLAASQMAYRAQVDLWNKVEQERKAELAKVLVAFSGRPEEDAAKIWEPSTDLNGARRNARITIRMGWVVFGLFVGMTAAFVVAMVILSLGLLH